MSRRFICTYLTSESEPRSRFVLKESLPKSSLPNILVSFLFVDENVNRFMSYNKVSWQTARLYCSGQGTLLLILGNDSREWDFIVQHAVLSSESYWIGLTDAITGHWRWVDGTPYTMNSSQWEPGEPNNWLGEEDCGELTASGKLNDGHCSKKFRFICKQEPWAFFF
uniref:Asialoglycoprotein receptor 1b n=1 Tax=Cyprinus carpio carpio TaxID=630221 RepID=A0A8C1B2J3_CYPCA